MDDKVLGVHYCGFQEGTEETITKDELNARIDEYALMLPLIALMLPLIVKGKNFVKQFTLVYSDWTVLRSDNKCIDKCLFGELLGEQGVRRDQIF